MIQPKWKNKVVVCIASGPSLDTDDLDYIRDKDCCVIAINDNYKLAPWADMLYACDLKWWNWHNGAPEFGGERWTQDKTAPTKYEGLNYVEGRNGKGLSTDPEYINTGHNSGFQAINMAYLLGASKIILTGYDMHIPKSGEAHWFGDHPDKVRGNFERWTGVFDDIAKQNLVEIVNCTRKTVIQSFPLVPLKEAL